MSEQNYLGKLLDGAQVEWKKIGDVLVRTKGTMITASQMKVLHKDGALVKIFAGGRTVAFVELEDIPEKNINREPSVIVKSRGIIEFEYYDKPFSHKNEMWSYHSQSNDINIKYVYYFLKMNESYFQHIGSRMQMPQIAIPDTDNFQIPIPPLKVQQEIVRILDTFTTMTNELTNELKLREKQYNCYRDNLLNFKGISGGGRGNLSDRSSLSDMVMFNRLYGDIEVEWMALGSVANIGTGSSNRQDENEKGAYPFYVRSKNVLRSDTFQFDETAIVIPGEGGVGDIFHYVEGKYALHQRAYRVCINTPVLNPKFLYYFMSFGFRKYILMKSVGATSISIRKPMLEDFQIPIPCPDNPQKSLAVQSEIVRILDVFSTLIHSISEGLPREIELRRKQYEYYRDLLLSFPRNIKSRADNEG